MACPSSCKDESCTLTFREHLLGIGVAPSATPTRGKGWHAARTNKKDAQFDKDSAAYRRLRKEGLQPRNIDGSAALEQKAEVAEHVTTGMTHVKPAAFERFNDAFGHRATEPAK